MKTIIVWYRSDLRLHDHPALWSAAEAGDFVVPVFIFNDRLLTGKHAGSNRNRFLLECLSDLRTSLQAIGGDIVLRSGNPAEVLIQLAQQVGAEAIYYTADYTPYAIARDKQVKQKLTDEKIQFRSFSGRLIVDQLQKLATKTGTTHKIFTPFWKNWMAVPRRAVADVPSKLALPPSLDRGTLPKLATITDAADLSPEVMLGGETAGRKRMDNWLATGIDRYHLHNNQLSSDGTSRLSPYLHFGCISARELESRLTDSDGARAYNRQLCWRDFYHYIFFNFPNNADQEFQERYRAYDWGSDKKLLQAWQQGKTGYPVVDAAMRQLNTEGWMHNRGRLIVGSFLTKDLGLDWRLGETYFMRMLLDGDESNNNGNWQWIASVGVDPAPVFRRLYNPTLQQEKFDSSDGYVHKFVPELQKVPKKYLTEPWNMPEAVQQDSDCIIGHDYPNRIVDHAAARLAALEKYRTADSLYQDSVANSQASPKTSHVKLETTRK